MVLGSLPHPKTPPKNKEQKKHNFPEVVAFEWGFERREGILH